MKKFPLCFWNYANFEQMGQHPVKDWTDAGFGMALSPVFRKGIDRPEQMVRLLDECLENDISVIIDDKRCKWTGALRDPEKYKADFTEMLSEFGAHPAVWGFYVGDEPRAEQAEEAIAAVKLQKNLCPAKKPFINFFPYFDGNDALYGKDYDEWIGDFISKSGLDQFSYDLYDQLQEECGDETFSGINHYYTNLRKNQRIAKANNVPLWVTDLSIGHFKYRCPTEDDFRWQLNTSVACGAGSVWWFFLYYRLARVNYRLPLIDEYGNRTESYVKLARVQNVFQHQFGELFTHLIYENTHHIGLAYGGCPLFEYKKHPFVKAITSSPSVPGLISDFRSPDGEHYIVLVNNSQKSSAQFSLQFHDTVKGLYRVAYHADEDFWNGGSGLSVGDQQSVLTKWGDYEVDCAKNNVSSNYQTVSGVIFNHPWLAPGQMEVYRLILNE